MEKTARIREEIQILQDECKRMTQEVDRQAPESRKYSLEIRKRPAIIETHH